MVTATVPWPETSGNRRRLSSVLRGLGLLGAVDVFVLGGQPASPPPTDLPIDLVHQGPPIERDRSFLTLSRGLVERQLPTDMLGLDARRVRQAMSTWIAETGRRYDVVWFNRPPAFLATAGSVDGMHVVDLDDLEDQKLLGRLAAGVTADGVWGGATIPGWRYLARAKLRHNAATWRRLHLRIAREADAVVLSSSEDRRRSGLTGALVLPNCYPAPPEPFGRQARSEPTILLVGLMTYRPNADAAVWFAREVLPGIRRSIPGAHVRIVGEASETVRALASEPGVTVTGRVEDLDPEIRRAAIAVAPIRFGGGTRLKILEAWAHRLPVVTTTVGATGLGARHDEHLLLADDAPSFARACVAALTDAELGGRLADAGQRLYRERYRCEVVERELAARVADLLESERGSATP